MAIDELAELRHRATIEYCDTLERAGDRIPVPAIDVARRIQAGTIDASRYPLLRDLVARCVIPWTRERFLEAWLEGEDALSVRSTRLGRTLYWLVDAEEHSRGMRSDSDLFVAPSQSSRPTSAAHHTGRIREHQTFRPLRAVAVSAMILTVPPPSLSELPV